MGRLCSFCVLLWVLALGGTGCRHVERPGLTPQKTAFRFYGVDTNTRPEKKGQVVEGLQAGVMFMSARAIEPLALPEYPDIPAAERSRWVIVGVRLDIDREGRVINISPSAIMITTSHARLAVFRKAIEAAVTQWRFFPAEERHMEKATGKDGAPYWRASRVEQVESSVDIAFTFTASGDVRSN